MSDSHCPRRTRQRLRTALVFASATVCTALCAQPLVWSGRVGLASHWIVRGQQASDGDAPVVFAGADAYGSTGWSLGGAALRLRDRDGNWSDGWSLHAGHETAIDADWRWLVDLQHVGYEGSAALAAWRGPRLALGLAYGDRWSLTWNAEQPRDQALAARSVDFNIRWPLRPQLSIGGGIGRVVSSQGPHNSYGQIGLTWHVGGWQAQLDRTWGPSNTGYGQPLGPRARWLAGTQWAF